MTFEFYLLSGETLRLEIDRSFVVAVHVEGDGAMLVCDRPLAVDFAEAEGLAKPRSTFTPSCRRRHHPVQAVAEGLRLSPVVMFRSRIS